MCRGGGGASKPQNVLPRANHWMPDATVKSVGVGEARRTDDMPPVRRPVVPRKRVSWCELEVTEQVIFERQRQT